jgi:hypothetical protein
MAWDPQYLKSAGLPRFNPWPIKYLMPAEKWLPLFWPNEEWEVISFPPAFDEQGNRLAPKPPEGAIGPWWKMLPKDQWPVEAPWEGKVFGAWPASQITMSEDLPPSIWPGGHRAPPFGFIKIKMPGDAAISGDQTPKGNQIPFNHMRIHMRPDLGPIHHMKILTRVDAFGETKFYMIDKNWDQQEYNYREYRAALKARRQERFMQMLAAEIEKNNGRRKPRVDLF